MMNSRKLHTERPTVSDYWDWPLQHEEDAIKVLNTDERFEVGLDVAQFKPHEIEVKVMGLDLVIHCRNDTDGKASRMAREIHRVYHLPDDVDMGSLRSYLNARGTLIISAAKILKEKSLQ